MTARALWDGENVAVAVYDGFLSRVEVNLLLFCSINDVFSLFLHKTFEMAEDINRLEVIRATYNRPDEDTCRDAVEAKLAKYELSTNQVRTK